MAWQEGLPFVYGFPEVMMETHVQHEADEAN
jgi:hypothetical protein